MHGDLSLARHIKFHYPGHQSQEPATQVTYSLTWISLQIQNFGFRLQGSKFRKKLRISLDLYFLNDRGQS